MRLRPEQIEDHLQRNPVKPVYLVSGDEPLQKLECIDSIRQFVRTQGYDERIVFDVDKSFDWDAIRQETGNLSLFASKKIIELRMISPKPGREGGQVLTEFSEQPAEGNLLIVSTDKMDKATQNTKWARSLEKAGIIIQVWPIDSARLPGWIQSRIQLKQKRITLDAARLIAQKVEGNLLAARQEIDKLALLINKEEIDVHDVIAAVADSARYDVFNMIESAYLGHSDRALLMLSGLRNEGTEPLALFGAFMWEFRRTCNMAHQLESGTNLKRIFSLYRIWDNKKRALSAILNRHSLKRLQRLLSDCAGIDKTLKSNRREQAWDQLSSLLLAIAGINTEKLQRL